MRTTPFAAFVALLATPLAAQTPAAPPPAATPVAPDPAAPAKAARGTIDADPAMWVVKDADTTVYLFGTVHLLDPRYAWFDGPVKAAFDRSDELVVETVSPPPAEAQPVVMKLATATDGRTLTEKLGPKTAPLYAGELKALGMAPTALDRFDPWFAAVTLTVLQFQKLGYGAEAGVDPALIAAAKAAGKPVVPLEGFEEQLGFLDGLAEKDQIAFLRVGLEQMDKAPEVVGRLMSTWSTGDERGLADAMNEGIGDLPQVRKRLLDDRNVRWADWVKARMAKPGTVFVAVGAGHLGGPGSLRERLAKQGLKAVRVTE